MSNVRLSQPVVCDFSTSCSYVRKLDGRVQLNGLASHYQLEIRYALLHHISSLGKELSSTVGLIVKVIFYVRDPASLLNFCIDLQSISCMLLIYETYIYIYTLLCIQVFKPSIVISEY